MRAELERRPAVALLGGAIVGVTAIAYPLNLLFLGAQLWLLRPLSVRWLTVLGFLVGLTIHPLTPAPLATTGWMEFEATIAAPPKPSPFGLSVAADVHGRPVVLFVDRNSHFEKGERVAVGGLVKEPQRSDVMGPVATVKVVRWKRLAPPPFWDRGANRWKASLASLLDYDLSPGDRDFVMALTFGGRDNLTREEFDAAQDEGWTHLVAASGLQVLALVALLEGLTSLVPIPRPVLLGVLTALLAVYAIASGVHAATTRAVLVVVLARWAYTVKREPDSLSSVAVAGLAILLLDPREAFGLGFRMTLLVLAAFALFMPHSGKRETKLAKRVVKSLRDCLRASAIAALVGVPVVAQLFHHVALKGFVASVAVVSFVPVIVGLTFVALFLSWIWMPLGVGCVTLFVHPLASGLRGFYALLQPLDLAFDVPAFSGYWLALYFGLWLWAWRRFDRPG